MNQRETYLGDGLYASWDGFAYTLRAPRGIEGDHYVVLEPEVLGRIRKLRQAHRSGDRGATAKAPTTIPRASERRQLFTVMAAPSGHFTLQNSNSFINNRFDSDIFGMAISGC